MTVDVQSAAGTTAFNSKVSMAFGAGDDTLNLAIGGQVVLNSLAAFDGGRGKNTLHQNKANLISFFQPLERFWT